MLAEIGFALSVSLLFTPAEVPASNLEKQPPAAAWSIPAAAQAAGKLEGPKWAPNRMKILLFQRKGRWVEKEKKPPIERRGV